MKGGHTMNKFLCKHFGFNVFVELPTYIIDIYVDLCVRYNYLYIVVDELHNIVSTNF